MPFCFHCAFELKETIPKGDNRLRWQCYNCDHIAYENPKVVVGLVPLYDDKILLCKRAIEPAYGKWTLPAGFMECDESISDGALRESNEEAGIDVELKQLFSTYSVPNVNQVHMYFLAQMTSAKLNPGPETLEAKFFALTDIPWADIAFSSVTFTLKKVVEHHANLDNKHFSK